MICSNLVFLIASYMYGYNTEFELEPGDLDDIDCACSLCYTQQNIGFMFCRKLKKA